MSGRLGKDGGFRLALDRWGAWACDRGFGTLKDFSFNLLSAYGLTSLFASFWLNPLGDFLSKTATTLEAFILQILLFISFALINHLLFRAFPSINRKLYTLLVFQTCLMLFAWRSCDTAFASGAFLVSLTLSFYGRREWRGLDSAAAASFWRSSFITVNGAILFALFFNNLSRGGLMEDPLLPAGNRPILTRTDLASLLLGLTAAGLSLIIFFLVRERGYQIGRKRSTWLLRGLLLAAFLPTLYLALIMVMRTRGLNVPTYDMGIFTQMFHSMKRTGAPVTSLERDQLLSHFKVHLSPVFYLLLPFFLLSPKAETLQVLQVLLVASSVIPLGLLTRKFFPDSPARQLLLPAVFLLQPAMLGSSLYDLHENCFLAPFLLWLLYFALSRNRPAVYLFTLLTLSVKEDAGLYILAIALYLLIGEGFAKGRADRKKEKTQAVILIAISLLHFTGSVWYLTTLGDGAMLNRYQNLEIYPSLGLPGLALSALQNPVYYLATMWTSGKINYLLIVLSSLGFLPALQKKAGNFVLFLPFMAMNLLSNYGYQYELAYQYHYGSGVLLLFLFLLALRDLPGLAGSFAGPAILEAKGPLLRGRGRRAFTALLAFTLAVGASQSFFLLRERKHYIEYVKENKHEIEEIKAGLADIPDQVPVGATSSLTVALASRTWLYDLDFHKASLEDGHLPWLAFDNRGLSQDLEDLLESCLAFGYVESDLSNGSLRILVWPASLESGPDKGS